MWSEVNYLLIKFIVISDRWGRKLTINVIVTRHIILVVANDLDLLAVLQSVGGIIAFLLFSLSVCVVRDPLWNHV
jgi:hypothetical protein